MREDESTRDPMREHDAIRGSEADGRGGVERYRPAALVHPREHI